MLNVFSLIVGALWLIVICRLVLLVVATWQLKEYRWDRMREHLRLGSTKQMLLSPLEIAKWLVLLLLIVGNTLFGMISWFVLAIYVLDFILVIKEVKRHMLIRPVMTMKAMLIIIITGIIIFGLLSFWLIGSMFTIGSFIVLDRAVSMVITILVFMFSPFSNLLKLRTISAAKKLRVEMHQLRVIGITGSYGKSSTKNIVATILEGEELLVTPGNTNTEIGVAQFMLKRLKPQIKYFVAEMGAYRLGEIEKLAKLVKPKIGVLTAIGNQHLGLFGSHENIRRAKYELIKSLPSDGAAIFNADDPNCLELAKATSHCEVLMYGLSDEADLQAQIISSNENGIEIKVFGLVPETTLTLPAIGDHQIGNILAGILVAIVLGKNWQNIQAKLPSIKMEKQTMEKYFTAQGALVIDDSYNANVNGVIAAIENLNSFSQSKKVVVLTTMIELGDDAIIAHNQVGAALAKVATHVFYAGTDFQREIVAGSFSVKPDLKIEILSDAHAILKKLTPLLNKDTVVLLEGRVPKLIRETLKTK